MNKIELLKELFQEIEHDFNVDFNVDILDDSENSFVINIDFSDLNDLDRTTFSNTLCSLVRRSLEFEFEFDPLDTYHLDIGYGAIGYIGTAVFVRSGYIHNRFVLMNGDLLLKAFNTQEKLDSNNNFPINGIYIYLKYNG